MSLSYHKTKRVQLQFKGERSQTLTEQSHADSCDIHVIMSRYRKTGLLDHVQAFQGQYMDLPTPVDFHQAQNILAEAASMFETVPSDIRAKFNNDPANYIGFMQDPKNKSEIEKMGLDASHLPDPKSAAKAAKTSPPSGDDSSVGKSTSEGGKTPPSDGEKT